MDESAQRLLDGLGDYMRKAEIRQVACKFCGSTDVVFNGHRKGTQYFLCRSCGRGFVNNQAVPRGHFPVDMVARALYNYYAGMSLNAICEGIKQGSDGDKTVSDTTIYNWLARYTAIALNEAGNYKPQVGKKWLMDETVVTLNGKKYWLITALDKDTRFLLGTKLSTNRCGDDIRELLENATAKTGYPYENWGDVVRSEMPKVELTDEDRSRYRVDRKARRIRRKRIGRSDTPAMMRGMRE